MISSLVFTALLVIGTCAPHPTIIRGLLAQWGEVVVSRAVDNSGHLVETTVNKDTGTWSIIISKPMKLTCVIVGGNGWREVIPEDPNA